jgi:hypothetical protein
MVLPTLKPDILRRVVDFAIHPDFGCTEEANSQLERQRCLANLIRVSKVCAADEIMLMIRLSKTSVPRYSTKTALSAMSTSSFTDPK